MYKYKITLTNGSLLMATSSSSLIYTIALELKEGISLFLHIGNVVVRKSEIESIEEREFEEEVEVDE